MPRHRGNTVYVRKDAWAMSTTWLTEFEARAIAAEYLRQDSVLAEGSLDELQIFLCRGAPNRSGFA